MYILLSICLFSWTVTLFYAASWMNTMMNKIWTKNLDSVFLFQLISKFVAKTLNGRSFAIKSLVTSIFEGLKKKIQILFETGNSDIQIIFLFKYAFWINWTYKLLVNCKFRSTIQMLYSTLLLIKNVSRCVKSSLVRPC